MIRFRAEYMYMYMYMYMYVRFFNALDTWTRVVLGILAVDLESNLRTLNRTRIPRIVTVPWDVPPNTNRP